MGPRHFKNLKNWWNYMTATFGLNTLLVLFLVYWAQGFKQFGILAVTFYYKETLKLSASTTQFIRTVTYIAWFVKPFYGILSDNIPVFGFHRKSYLTLSGLAGVVSSFSLFFIEDPVYSCLALLVSEFSGAVSDVVADGIMVQESRKDPKEGSENLQSFCWMVLSLGGLIGAPLGGVALDHIAPKYILGSLFVCPLLLLFAANSLHEEPSTPSFSTVQTKLKDLFGAFKEPSIVKPMSFMFFARACSPSYPELTIYFMKDELEFSATFMSLMGLVGYLSLGIGSFMYKKFLKGWSFPKILGWGQVLLAFVGVLDLLLVTKAFELLKVPATLFALGGDSVSSVVNFTFSSMPFMVLSAKLCPEGCEATLFALFSSVINLSFATSILLGGVLTELFQVDTNNYEYIWLLMTIRIVTRLLPFFMLGLLPKPDKEEEYFIEFEVLDEPFNSVT